MLVGLMMRPPVPVSSYAFNPPSNLTKTPSHVQLIDTDGMQNALAPVDLARQAFGGPVPPGSNAIWEFPHNEARDLAGRIFGKANTLKYNPTKSNPFLPWHKIVIQFQCRYL
jgi:hypothetical protein